MEVSSKDDDGWVLSKATVPEVSLGVKVKSWVCFKPESPSLGVTF